MAFNFTVKEFILGGGTGMPTLQFFRRGFNLGGSGSSPTWKDIILHGVTALTLVNAKANGLNYLKLFGGTEQLAETYIDSVTLDGKCEQNGTPTPDNPVDIVCNNGVISYDSVNDTIIATGTTETITDNVGNVATAEMLLSVGNYKDTQEVLSGVVTSRIGYYVFDGTESFSTSTAYGKACLIVSAVTTWQAELTEVLCTHFLGIGVPSTSTPVNTCFFNSSGHFYFRLEDNTVETLKAWLAQQYANGTPVIVFFVKRDSSIVSETVTPQILNKEPLTVTGSLSGLVANVVSSTHTTPMPEQPLAINCNNGVLGVDNQGNIIVTGTVETVRVHGKNLWTGDFSQFDNIGGEGTTYAYFKLPKENTYYTLSVTAKKDYTASNTVALGFSGTGGSASDGIRWVIPTSGTILKDEIRSFSNYASKFLNYVCMYKTNSTTFDYISEYFDIQLEEGSTATDYEPYFNGGSATAEMLLSLLTKVGDSIYAQDTQNVTTGEVTRNIGTKAFDGTETWNRGSNLDVSGNYVFYMTLTDRKTQDTSMGLLCSHFKFRGTVSYSTMLQDEFCINQTTQYIYFDGGTCTTIDEWKAYLASQYANGKPVIIVYPLATATTETVTAQPLTIQAGTNVVEITQASIEDLPLEVSYKAKAEGE